MTYELHNIIFENNRFVERDKNKSEQTKIENVFEVSWMDNINKYFVAFNFTVHAGVKIGDAVELYNKDDDAVVFRGFITHSIRTQKDRVQYYGYDIGYLLNKCRDTFDFKHVKITDALKKICNDINFPISSNLVKEDTELKRIYRNKCAKDAISDILKGDPKLNNYSGPVNQNLFIDCSSGELELKEYTRVENLYGKISNLYRVNSMDTIQKDFSITQIINSEGVKEKQEQDKLTMFSDYRARKGIIIPINNKELNLNGDYLIEQSIHIIQGVVEKVEIGIKKVVYDS